MSGKREQQAIKRDSSATVTKGFHYVPPCAFLLEGLGISAADFEGSGTITVTRRCLQALISEVARQMQFDDQWYSGTYPDVEGARLAGDVKSLREHFISSGYLEGRVPIELPFDPQWYWGYYADIAKAFPSADPDAMRIHFQTKGYFEGRAGTAEMLLDVNRWLKLVKGD